MLNCGVLVVNRYLERIGYTGSRNANFDNLKKLCWCHATSIPQDTLDMFGGPRKIFNLDKIYNDFIVKRRGGFCYELNGLFGSLLETLGYKLSLLEGNCFVYSCDAFSFRFNHLLLKVHLNGQDWIVDVGYGLPSFFEPMKLELWTPQTQMTGIYRFREGENECYYVEKKRKKIFNIIDGREMELKVADSKYSISDDWEILFKFSTTSHQWEDFQVGFDRHLNDSNGFFTNNSFLEMFSEKGGAILWGSKYIEKEFTTPMTEKIRITEMLPDDGDVEANKQRLINLMKSKFGVELEFWPNFTSKTWSRFTFE